MADGDRGVAVQQQHRHRLPDDVAAADHHSVLTADRNLLALEQLDDTGGRAGDELGTILREQPDALGTKSIHVLVGRDGVEHALLGAGAHGFRQRGLHQDAVVDGALIQPLDQPEDVVERRRFRHSFEIDPEAHVAAGLHLVPHVHL